MDFELTEEQKLLKQTVINFLGKEIAPLVEEYEEQKKFPRDLIKKMIPLGFVAGLVPEEDGGDGLDFLTYGLLMEELGRVWGSFRVLIYISAWCMAYIAQKGNKEQKERFLPPMLAGDQIGCMGITEPNVGSNPGDIEATAKLDGDHYVINGTKIFISNGGLADICLVFASTDRSKKINGIACFIVEKKVSHFKARELRKMGLDCSSLAELIFEDCRVPKENLIAPPGEAFKGLLQFFCAARAMLALVATGAAQAAIDASIRYAKERTQFGKSIGSFQLIQEMIVDMVTEKEAARLLALRALSLLDKGINCVKESSMAKFYATEMAHQVCSKAIQIHGGYGYTREFPLERYYRDIRGITIGDGTTQIQKLIVGSEILGIRAFV